MQEIEKLRSEIDEIHAQLASLFRKRLLLAQRIWEIKKSQKISFIDSSREYSIVHRFDEKIHDPAEKLAVQNFFKCILDENKKILEAQNLND
jgi:chorismate mutase